MKKKLVNLLKIVAFLSVGVILFWLVYRHQDFGKMWQAIINSRYQWILLAMFLGILSHISRVMRWRLMITPLGYKPRFSTLFFAVMIMYLSNLAIPRSGEVVRCATASKYEKVPFSTLLGTVVTERIVDMIMMTLALIVAIIIQFSHLHLFWENNPQLAASVQSLGKYIPWIIALVVAGIAGLILIYIYRERLKQKKVFAKFYQLLDQFWQGIISIANMDRKWEFIGHSFFIWTMYFLMAYVIFFAFDFTSHLSLAAGFVVFVMSTLGMVFPSPGGMGSWDFMAIESLKLYGVQANPYGATYAFTAHATQIILLVSFGLLSLIALSFIKPVDYKTIKTQENE